MTHFSQTNAVTQRLVEGGLSREAASAKAQLFARVAEVLGSPDAEDNRQGFFVPGRIEVLGKHTDYAGGSSMVVAAEQGFCLLVRPRQDNQIQVTDALSGETARFEMDPQLTPRAGHWSNYPMTVARRVARNFPTARQGAEIAFAGDLPPAAGMSSSSALIISMFLALDAANRLAEKPEYLGEFHSPANLAAYLGTIENGQTYKTLQGDRGVGTFGGSEDHTAILCGRPEKISQYAYCPVHFERTLGVPGGHTFAVGVSGVVAEKTGAAQEKDNRASRLVTTIVEVWRHETGREDATLAGVVRQPGDNVDRLKQLIASAGRQEFSAADLSTRLEHFLVENEQVLPAAGEALRREDLEEFGRCVDRSQQATEELLGNQIPQTCALAALARQHGAAAASAFGAGFGGSVWALVEKVEADTFLAKWADAYRQQFPQNAQSCSFFTTAAGPAAFRVTLQS